MRLIAFIFICYSLASEKEDREKENERKIEKETSKNMSA